MKSDDFGGFVKAREKAFMAELKSRISHDL
jgi:hypothetical protein